MKTWTSIILAALAVPAASLADDLTAPPTVPTPWSGDASAGYLRTTGNTNSTSLNAKANVDWKSAPWENQFTGQGAYASSKGASTAEAYQASDKLSYDLSPNDFVFTSLGYSNDRFAGIVSRFTEAVGYGRHLVRTDRQTLDGSIGAGLSQQRRAEDNHYGDQFVGLFDLAYTLKITDTSQFKQTLHVESGKDNTFINPVSELRFVVIGNIIATLGYDWRHNTSVPPGNVHTDTMTTINFGYTFGKKPT